MIYSILDIDIIYFIYILIFIAVVCFFLWKILEFVEELIKPKIRIILLCLSLICLVASYKLYSSFSYKTNSAKEEAIQNYMQAIESKIDPRFKDKFKEQFSSMPDTLGFNLCYENNYTGETCLNYLFYCENKIKDKIEIFEEEFLKIKTINNNINNRLNQGEKNESRN
ncbi:hypothetical protein XJ45_07780 [Campylobacter coli]|nr:hypothetical protein [Campylobacter coli]